MSKAVKLKNNLYLDTRGIVHNKKILNTILFPIGYVYISVNNTNPGTIFGGTWEQIKDTFLLACGDTYANGATGGEATHTLTVDEMPRHNHAIEMTSGGVAYQVERVPFGNQSVWGNSNLPIKPTGGSQPHNNLQPYITCYMWKRTA